MKFPFLEGGGEMGELTRNHNWSKTSLGTPDQWPQSLRTTISIILNSRFPMFLFWGPEHLCFYNDAYRPSLGNNGKHPGAIGRPASAVFPEVWEENIQPVLERILSGGEASWNEDRQITIYRNGALETGYWTSSYSPVKDETGKVAGVFVACTETTEKVQMLATLKEGEARLRSVVEQAPLAIGLLKGPEMIVEGGNDVIFQLWGKDRSITGNPLIEALPELEGQPFMGLLENVYQTGERFNANGVLVKMEHGGIIRDIYADFIYAPLRTAGGDVTGVLVLATDVTEQARTRQKTEASEAKLRTLIQSAPAAIGMFVGRDLIIESPNKSFIEVIGRGPDIEGRSLKAVMPELEQQPFLELLDNVFTSGQVFQAHAAKVQVLKNGQLQDKYFNVTFSPVFNEHGAVYAIIDVSVDVTDQVLDAQKLQEAEGNMRSAVELAQLGTWTIDVQTSLFTASARLQSWFGFGEGEDFYTTGYNPIHEKDRDGVIAALTEALRPGSNGIYDIEYTVIEYRTGNERIHHAHGKVVLDEAGKPLRLQGTAQDVTVQRQLQLNLEHEVQLRTEELAALNKELLATNEELAESNNSLTHSNEELAQYAYVASHDLQEPLRKIRIFTGLLAGQQNESDSNRRIIEKISQSAERMSLLIKDLLDFSRLLKSDTLMRPVNLTEVMKAVGGDFELTIQEKGARIEIGDLPTITAVSLQMNQLFYNLLSNALKFTDGTKSPRISVSARQIPVDEVRKYIRQPLAFSNYYEIIFTDNGIGFELAYSEQIFEVFKRLHGREIYPGSGIGLALCRRIVGNHHGHIYTESKPGVGTTFHIILPEKHTEHPFEPSENYPVPGSAN